MQLFYLGDEMRISDVMSHLHISRSTASRILNSLIEKGVLERLGEGPATRYTRKQGPSSS